MLCLSCKMDRTPSIKHVEKKGKKWVITACRICKQQDIEQFVPARVWNNKKMRFEDEEFKEGEEC